MSVVLYLICGPSLPSQDQASTSCPPSQIIFTHVSVSWTWHLSLTPRSWLHLLSIVNHLCSHRVVSESCIRYPAQETMVSLVSRFYRLWFWGVIPTIISSPIIIVSLCCCFFLHKLILLMSFLHWISQSSFFLKSKSPLNTESKTNNKNLYVCNLYDFIGSITGEKSPVDNLFTT